MNETKSEFLKFIFDRHIEHLLWIKEKPKTLMSFGIPPHYFKENFPHTIIENLENADWVIDFMNLHFLDDPLDHLNTCYQKTKSCFSTVFIGGDSFLELKEALNYADHKVYKGSCVRIIPMIHPKQLTWFLRTIGFLNSIVNVEKIKLTYDSLETFFHEMKLCNMNYTCFKNPPLSKDVLSYAESYLRENFDNTFSIELIFGIGFKNNLTSV